MPNQSPVSLYHWGILAIYEYGVENDYVNNQNVEWFWSRSEQLKNILEKALLSEIQIPFNLHIAQTSLFQMRYDSMPNSVKQPSDSLRG